MRKKFSNENWRIFKLSRDPWRVCKKHKGWQVIKKLTIILVYWFHAVFTLRK